MITFAEAMLITHGEMEGNWEFGTLHILPKGRESKTHYVVFFGAREWIIDRNMDFLATDVPIAFVDKENGACKLEAVLFVRERLDAMHSVALSPSELKQFNKDLQGA